jgi:hypothetical protein
MSQSTPDRPTTASATPSPLPAGAASPRALWGDRPRIARIWLARAEQADTPPPRRSTYVYLAVLTALALLTVTAPAGLHWPVLAALVVAVVRSARPPVERAGVRLPAVLAVMLVSVGALRTNGLLGVCLLGAVGLASSSLLRALRWREMFAVPLVGVRCATQGVIWLARPLRRTVRGRAVLPWVKGAVLGLPLAVVVLVLLSSADGAFAGLVERLALNVDINPVPRLLATGALVGLAIGLALARVAPPSWNWLPVKDSRRPAAEWALPLVLLDAVLVAFLMVQAVVLFDAYPDALVSGDLTPADRARQGFGQLVVVTVLIALALGRAARRADPDNPRHRAVLGILGGTALLAALALVASALRRMWLYEQVFGWTVLRLEVGVFELWLGGVLVVAGWAWLTRRTAGMPRLVTTSAGAVLLVLALVSPDALVARWNVDRYEHTGRFDAHYASKLSLDAAGELARLPEPLRSQALHGHDEPTPWYVINLTRLLAERTTAGLSR